LQAFFIVVIAVSFILVKGLGILSFNDRWWDVTVLVFLVSIISFIMGIKAVRKHRENLSWFFI